MIVDIDDKLIAKAQKLTKIKSAELLINNALTLLVTVTNQKELLELWSKVVVDES